MKIIIIGAGELGQLWLGYAANHDVTIIDSSKEGFDRLREQVDVMTFGGDATDVDTMKQAGIQHADLLIAVSGDQSSNILACQIAGRFGVKNNICRLYSLANFSDEDGLTPSFFGIQKAFSSPAECARKVMDVLQWRIVLERMHFSNPLATMVTMLITPDSPWVGLHIKDLPNPELLSNIRFAALVRDNHLMTPHGATILQPGDKVYVSGRQDAVDAFLARTMQDCPTAPRPLVILAGATRLAKIIADELVKQGTEVRIIEKSPALAESFLNSMPSGVMVVKGAATDEDVLGEAGIDDCTTFVSTQEDDEDSILSCILAKRLGARKVVAVTHKPEYINIVPAMGVIDAGFNSTLVSVNTIFRLMEQGNFRIDSRLMAFQAYLAEFTLRPHSRLNGKRLKDCQLPPALILAMIFRAGEVITPAGGTVLQPGDTIVAVVTSASEELIKHCFE